MHVDMRAYTLCNMLKHKSLSQKFLQKFESTYLYKWVGAKCLIWNWSSWLTVPSLFVILTEFNFWLLVILISARLYQCDYLRIADHSEFFLMHFLFNCRLRSQIELLLMTSLYLFISYKNSSLKKKKKWKQQLVNRICLESKNHVLRDLSYLGCCLWRFGRPEHGHSILWIFMLGVCSITCF